MFKLHLFFALTLVLPGAQSFGADHSPVAPLFGSSAFRPGLEPNILSYPLDKNSGDLVFSAVAKKFQERNAKLKRLLQPADIKAFSVSKLQKGSVRSYPVWCLVRSESGDAVSFLMVKGSVVLHGRGDTIEFRLIDSRGTATSAPERRGPAIETPLYGGMAEEADYDFQYLRRVTEIDGSGILTTTSTSEHDKHRQWDLTSKYKMIPAEYPDGELGAVFEIESKVAAWKKSLLCW